MAAGITGIDVAFANDPKILKNRLRCVHAMPYQFMETVDRREELDGSTRSKFGRKYSEKIVGRMPLLYLTPGHQVFMSDYNKEDKSKALFELIANAGGGSNETGIVNLIKGKEFADHRYYTFEFDYEDYYEYVNPACNAVAALLGIGDINSSEVGLPGDTTLKSLDWSKVAASGNGIFDSYISSKENVIFYINASTSVSESFSNDTTQSSLASSINGLSDQAKEVQFLLGTDDTSKILDATGDAISSLSSVIGNVVSSFTSGNGVLRGIASNGINTILSGGKLVFPELWADSDRSESYDIDIKLRSPDCDNLSIYLNIIVPYIHLLAMTAPHQVYSKDGENFDVNSYDAPFLVRASYQGSFNVDMGLITSLSCTKGDEGQWNDSGLPTTLDVSLSIKDLYSSFYMSKLESKFSLFEPQQSVLKIINNTAEMDYLSNLAGINLAQPELTRKIRIWHLLSSNSIKQMPNTVLNSIEQSIANKLQKLFDW